MVDVVVSTPELTVLGGPSSIQLDTNVGAAGNRGVFVFFGRPNPNEPNAIFTETPIVFDLYIITDSSSDDYLSVYQYIIQDGVPLWIFRIRLRPNFYGTNRVATFINGEAEININALETGLFTAPNEIFTPSFEDTRFEYSVQATLSNYEVNSESDPLESSTHFPAAVSVMVGDLFLDESDNETKLPITLYGAEFNGTSMVPIHDKNVVVHLSILVVSPNDVLDFIDVGGDS